MITLTSTVSGQLSSRSDVDYFKFTISEAKTVSLSFNTPTDNQYNSYFTASILDGSDNVLGSQSSGEDFTLTTALSTAGDYYLKIEDDTFHNGEAYTYVIA